MRTRHKVFIGIGVLVLLIGLVVASAFMPPYFVQAGNHFAGGTSLADVNGILRCDPVGQPDCTVSRESLVAAIANDPVIGNWFPIRFEFLTFE